MIVLASTITELQYDALLNDPSIAIIVLDAHPKIITVKFTWQTSCPENGRAVAANAFFVLSA